MLVMMIMMSKKIKMIILGNTWIIHMDNLMLMTMVMVKSFFQATLTVYRENGADGTVKVGI